MLSPLPSLSSTASAGIKWGGPVLLIGSLQFSSRNLAGQTFRKIHDGAAFGGLGVHHRRSSFLIMKSLYRAYADVLPDTPLPLDEDLLRILEHGFRGDSPE